MKSWRSKGSSRRSDTCDTETGKSLSWCCEIERIKKAKLEVLFTISLPHFSSLLLHILTSSHPHFFTSKHLSLFKLHTNFDCSLDSRY